MPFGMHRLEQTHRLVKIEAIRLIVEPLRYRMSRPPTMGGHVFQTPSRCVLRARNCTNELIDEYNAKNRLRTDANRNVLLPTNIDSLNVNVTSEPRQNPRHASLPMRLTTVRVSIASMPSTCCRREGSSPYVYS